MTALPRVGISISTLNRRDFLDQCLAHYRQHTPPEFPIVVVDDGSDVPVPEMDGITVIRHDTPQGIAVTKNAGIAALMDLGVDYLILSDDDCWPIADDYWQPYVASGEHHLSYLPANCAHILDNARQGADVIADDGHLFAVKWGSGCFLFYTRECIDTVGGMRPEYGRWSCDHWDLSYRIRNVGLIKYPFQDVHHSQPTLYAVDEHEYRRTCISEEIRSEYRERNQALFEQFKNATDFVPYAPEAVAKVPARAATVCMPWRATEDRLPGYVRCAQFWTDHGLPLVEADSNPALSFLCSEARNNAVRHADTDVVVIADADTVVDDIAQLREAIRMVRDGEADLVYPYTVFCHIPMEWATKDDYTEAPIQRQYVDSPGAVFVIRKDTLQRFGGFDERFVPGALGYDDTAFRHVASTLGTVARVPGVAWSFNHATDEHGLPDRDFSENNPNWPLYQLYAFAAGKPAIMRALIQR